MHYFSMGEREGGGGRGNPFLPSVSLSSASASCSAGGSNCDMKNLPVSFFEKEEKQHQQGQQGKKEEEE